MSIASVALKSLQSLSRWMARAPRTRAAPDRSTKRRCLRGRTCSIRVHADGFDLEDDWIAVPPTNAGRASPAPNMGGGLGWGKRAKTVSHRNAASPSQPPSLGEESQRACFRYERRLRDRIAGSGALEQAVA